MAGMHDERHPLPLTDHAARRSLVRAAARLLGPTEAEDAVQDAYVRVLESGTGTDGLNAAQAWLHTVVRNQAIDRLRRRQWMEQWVAQLNEAGSPALAVAPSAESDAALAQQSTRALRMLAARLAPADGAAVLLYEVFEASHAELARAGGRTEAGSRQQLRRALLRLRQAEPDGHGADEATLGVYLQALQLRDPRALWAMLGQPPLRAVAQAVSSVPVASAPSTTACGIVQVGGQLGLVLTLDGVRLCVLPLGVRAVCDQDLEPVAL